MYRSNIDLIGNWCLQIHGWKNKIYDAPEMLDVLKQYLSR